MIFDFDLPVTGIRTKAPHHQVNSLDKDKFPLNTPYNPMGQITTQGQKHFEWYPWGRLPKVTDPETTWEASYDALGRRLQTRYTSYHKTQTTTSLYDLEEEFQEIGIQIDDKIYNPKNCSGPLEKILTGIANSAVSIGVDIAECGLGHIGFHTPPVQLLKNQWAHFAMTPSTY